MTTTTFELPLPDGHRLTVIGVSDLNAIDLERFVGRRLVLVGDRETVGEDAGLVYHCLHLKLHDAGLLALVDAKDEVGLTEELLMGAGAAGGWAARGDEVSLVVVAPVSLLAVATCSAIAGGLRSPAAIKLVYGLAGDVPDADAEIFASVFEQNLRAREARRAARQHEGHA